MELKISDKVIRPKNRLDRNLNFWVFNVVQTDVWVVILVKNDVIQSTLYFLPVRTHEATAPEWQTLTQRLSSLVYNREHEIGVSFHTFCNNLQLNYRHIMQSLEPTTKKNEPNQGKHIGVLTK